MNSFPENPQQVVQPGSPVTGEVVNAGPAAPSDPIWTGMDVFRLFFMGAIIVVVSIFALLIFVPGTSFQQRALRLSKSAELLIAAQMVAYLLLLAYMYILVK